MIQSLAEMKASQASQGYSSAQREPETLAAIVKLYKHPSLQLKVVPLNPGVIF
jgi:hypothetical protein